MLTTTLLTASIAWAAACQESKPQAAPAARIAAVPATPPTEDPAELEKKYQEKLGKEFLKAGPWKLDYDAARDEARTAGKNLFVYFTRSYAP